MAGLFLALAYTALLVYVMRRSHFYRVAPGLSFRHVVVLFLIKIVAGALLWAIYTQRYPERVHADIFKYFDDSAVLYDAMWHRPGDFLRMLFGVGADGPYFVERYYDAMNNWLRTYDDGLYNDAHTMIRASALLRFLSFGWFAVHLVFAAFVGLTGLLALHHAMAPLLADRIRLVAVAWAMPPTVLLWTSAPIKECLLFLGLGVLLWQLSRAVNGGTLRNLVGVLLAVLLLAHVKSYVLACLAPALAVLVLGRRTGRPGLAMLVVYGTVLVALTLLAAYRPEWNALELVARKHRDFIGHGLSTGAGSFVMPPLLEPTMISFIQHMPYALGMALFGPVIHPSGGVLGLLAMAENLLLVLVPLVCLRYHRPWRSIDRCLLAALAGYCFTLLLIIGLTTPVMGALVRYRAPVLPFIFMAAWLVLDRERLLDRWPRLRTFLPA
jgi:hypothetical protein